MSEIDMLQEMRKSIELETLRDSNSNNNNNNNNNNTSDSTNRMSLTRSTSNTTLFAMEEVLQVSINRPPSTSPSDSHVNIDALAAPLRPSSSTSSKNESDGHAPASTPACQKHILVFDELLRVTLEVKIHSESTFANLKNRMLSAQGTAGVRIIPIQYQRILICGFEPSDESLVVSELQVHSLSCACGTSPCISVQPRIQELAAFFLSVFTISKEELTPPAIGRVLSDDDTSFFGAEGMEIESDDDEGRRTPPHQLSPPSSLTPVAKSPARPVVVLESREFTRRHKGNASQVCVEASGQCNDAALSARTTPNSCTDSEYKTSPALPGSSFSTSVHLSTSVTSMLVEQESSHLKGLDATLLMTMTDNQDEYESHTHLILKDRACCLRLLQRIKLDALVQLVLDVQGGLRSGHSPVETSSFSLPQEGVEETKPAPAYGSLQSDFDYGELVDNCCGGTYRMKGPDGQLCAIFKPSDEEPYAPENPKGYFGSMFEESAMKPGIRVGSGAARECSAYLLDHGGFASVPVTAMLYITHTVIVPEDKAEVQIKVGSLQRFHQHKCTAEDMGTCRFRMSDVHSIGVFDVRTFNMDRNSDNLLVASLLAGEARHGDESMLRLVPIDHGYILPSCKHLEDANLCWLYWPQARKPYEEETLRYIEGLDAEADESLLRMTLGLPEDCLLTLFIGTTLVQKGAAAGLTLHATGLLMLRDNPLEQSAIENVLAESLESCGLTGSSDSEWRSPKLRAELSERIENLVQETVGQRRVSANYISMYKTLSASRGGSSLGLDRLIIAEIA